MRCPSFLWPWRVGSRGAGRWRRLVKALINYSSVNPSPRLPRPIDRPSPARAWHPHAPCFLPCPSRWPSQVLRPLPCPHLPVLGPPLPRLDASVPASSGWCGLPGCFVAVGRALQARALGVRVPMPRCASLRAQVLPPCQCFRGGREGPGGFAREDGRISGLKPSLGVSQGDREVTASLQSPAEVDSGHSGEQGNTNRPPCPVPAGGPADKGEAFPGELSPASVLALLPMAQWQPGSSGHLAPSWHIWHQGSCDVSFPSCWTELSPAQA